jgi:hypothetical protein
VRIQLKVSLVPSPSARSRPIYASQSACGPVGFDLDRWPSGFVLDIAGRLAQNPPARRGEQKLDLERLITCRTGEPESGSGHSR